MGFFEGGHFMDDFYRGVKQSHAQGGPSSFAQPHIQPKTGLNAKNFKNRGVARFFRKMRSHQVRTDSYTYMICGKNGG